MKLDEICQKKFTNSSYYTKDAVVIIENLENIIS